MTGCEPLALPDYQLHLRPGGLFLLAQVMDHSFHSPLALRFAAFGYTLTLGACLRREAIDFTALVTTSHGLAQPLGWLWLTRKLTRKLNPSKTLAVSHAIATRTLNRSNRTKHQETESI